MFITSCKIEKNNIKLNSPFSYYLATLEHLPYILVTIKTDGDINGYGEAAIGWDTTGEMQDGSLEIFKLIEPILLKKRLKSLADVQSIMDEINKYIYQNAALKSGIEFALFDALAKKDGKPVWKILGGKEMEYIIPQKVFSFENQDFKQVADKIKEASENGVKIFKFKAGEEISPLVEMLAGLKRINPQYNFVLDVNQGWINFEQAMENIRKLEQFNIAWIEQPIYHKDFDGLAKIRQHTKIPIMADESCHDILDLENLYLRKSVDYINIKLAKCGGLLEAKKMIDFCEKHGIKYMLGSMINSTLGVASDLQAATLGNFMSHDMTFPGRVSNDKFSGLKFNGYKAYIPQDPGMGCRLS